QYLPTIQYLTIYLHISAFVIHHRITHKLVSGRFLVRKQIEVRWVTEGKRHVFLHFVDLKVIRTVKIARQLLERQLLYSIIHLSDIHPTCYFWIFPCLHLRIKMGEFLFVFYFCLRRRNRNRLNDGLPCCDMWEMYFQLSVLDLHFMNTLQRGIVPF